MSVKLHEKKRWIYGVSAGCLCYISSPVLNIKWLFITVLLSVITGFFMFGGLKIMPEKYKIYSLLGAGVCICSQSLAILNSEGISKAEFMVGIVCSIGALPLVNAVYGYFNSKYIPLLFGWVKKNKKTVMIGMAVSVMIAIIYIKITYMFYGLLNGIFSMDSIVYIQTNTYSFFGALENDIRQPLFGAVAGLLYGPFNAIQWFDEKIYAVFLGMTNPMLVIGGVVLLSSGCEKDEQDGFLLFCCSMFPSMLFMLCIEQYAVVFFALMFLMHEIVHKSGKYTEVYVGASGVLVTSMVALPLCNKKRFPDLQYMCKCLATFVGIVLMCGRTAAVLDFVHLRVLEKSYIDLGGYTEKLLQYSNFLRTVFLAPSAHIGICNYGNGMYEYQLDDVNKVSVVGMVLLTICLFSVVLNRKNRMVKIGAAWSLYSFFVLGVLGYGTKDNILPLYSLYFGWGYWVMIFSFFRYFKNDKICHMLFYTTITCVGIFNFICMIRIVQIGAMYYPV